MKIESSTMLALISGVAVIDAILYLVVFGLIFWLLHWLISAVGLQEPWAKVARVILAVAAVVIIINALLGLAGHSIIRW
jgi:hypothetical protein